MNPTPTASTNVARARSAPAVFLTLATLALAACGGSGNHTVSYGNNPPPPPPPPPPPAGSGYTFKSLVADISGTSASHVDAKLKNPWGIVFGGKLPVWTANNHSDTSSVYNSTGVNQLTVTVGGDPKNPFNPTGIVFNGSKTEFLVPVSGGQPAAASFIYSGESGMIAGWHGGPAAVVTYPAPGDVTGTNKASYKGLALANNGSSDFLYATDFGNNKVDVFDNTFKKAPAGSFPFKDPNLPAKYAPFGIQAITNGTTTQIYVTYAQQNGDGDNADGAGLGIVDIYDTNGGFVKRLVSDGGPQLNAPWGLALAPSDFGSLSNKLLVGNFGDGKINAFDPSTGAFVGTLSDGTGAAFALPGLWGIAFGNDAPDQPHNTLYYAAGTNKEADGDYGSIVSGSTSSTPPGGY